jgi:carbonic anhydrase
MENLINGYKRFRRKTWPRQRETFESLARNGQSPTTLALTCIDSRVDPAMIFDAGPGEMLVVRNVANLAPPYAPDAAYHGTSAALEFGVKVLNTPHIVVLGHGACAGARALLQGAPEDAREFVAPWMSIASQALTRALACREGDPQRCCEYELVKVSLDNLMTFPWIAERVEAGRLRLHGAWFGIESGELLILQPNGSFAKPTQ